MCDKAMRKDPRLFVYITDRFKTQKIRNEVMRIESSIFVFIPDHFKTQDMCNEAVRLHPSLLQYVFDHFDQEICDKAVRDDPRTLLFVVPDLFVTREGVAMCYDKSEYCNDDEDNFLSGMKVVKN